MYDILYILYNIYIANELDESLVLQSLKVRGPIGYLIKGTSHVFTLYGCSCIMLYVLCAHMELPITMLCQSFRRHCAYSSG
jgi:hypothetical protein